MFGLSMCILKLRAHGMTIHEASESKAPYLIFTPFQDKQHQSHIGLLAPPERWIDEYRSRIELLRPVVSIDWIQDDANYARYASIALSCSQQTEKDLT